MSSDDHAKPSGGKRYWECMPTVWAGVGEKRKRGLRILPKKGGYFVHVTSRTVGQVFLFGELEKRVFVQMMRKWADFSGLSVITHCLMDNHFHIMLWVPATMTLDHAEVLSRLEGIWPEEKVQAWERFYQQQKPETQEAMASAVMDRMANLSEFMRVLKQSFTCWYNRSRERKGGLWDMRYRSVVVEDSPLALMSVAAYIDLNPLRAGMVEDPKDYRFCGYGEAMKGNVDARKGLNALVRLARGHQPYVAFKVRRKVLSEKSEDWRVVGEQLKQEQMQREAPKNWQEVQAAYRIWLVNKGGSKAELRCVNAKLRRRKGLDPVQVLAEYERRGVLPVGDVLQQRMRTFTQGVAVGSPGFLEKLMGEYQSCFGAKRKIASRPVKGIGGLWKSLRQVE
ncbi:hypothetical protein P3T73_04435 [Kiritimatiellota bacterium B12222]|nr:hypothetical protein P3T73_04435 [Kiritimatiellota bacterium B12222]